MALFAAKQLVASTRSSIPFRHTANPRGFGTKSLFSDLIKKISPKEYVAGGFQRIPYTFCITFPDGKLRLPDGSIDKDFNVSLSVPGNYKMKETPEGGLSFFLDMGNVKWDDQCCSWDAELMTKYKAIFVKANFNCKTAYRSRINLPSGYENYRFRTETINGGMLVTLYKEDGESV